MIRTYPWSEKDKEEEEEGKSFLFLLLIWPPRVPLSTTTFAFQREWTEKKEVCARTGHQLLLFSKTIYFLNWLHIYFGRIMQPATSLDPKCGQRRQTDLTRKHFSFPPSPLAQKRIEMSASPLFVPRGAVYADYAQKDKEERMAALPRPSLHTAVVHPFPSPPSIPNLEMALQEINPPPPLLLDCVGGWDAAGSSSSSSSFLSHLYPGKKKRKEEEEREKRRLCSE